MKNIRNFRNFISENSGTEIETDFQLENEFNQILKNKHKGFESAIDDLINRGLKNRRDRLFKFAYDNDRLDIVSYLKSKGFTINNRDEVKNFVGSGRVARKNIPIEKSEQDYIFSSDKGDEIRSRSLELRNRKEEEYEKTLGIKRTDPEYYKRKSELDRERRRKDIDDSTMDIE
jgi:hypothetical protein